MAVDTEFDTQPTDTATPADVPAKNGQSSEGKRTWTGIRSFLFTWPNRNLPKPEQPVDSDKEPEGFPRSSLPKLLPRLGGEFEAIQDRALKAARVRVPVELLQNGLSE